MDQLLAALEEGLDYVQIHTNEFIESAAREET
jgi:hypothetical protein